MFRWIRQEEHSSREQKTLSVTVAEPEEFEDLAVSGQMLENAERTTQFLKSLAHPSRLVILCRLAESGASVGQLEQMLGVPQAAVSKQLARLREDGLVDFERTGRSIIYTLADDRIRRIIKALYAEFCV